MDKRVKLRPITSVGDYSWALHSTTEERGEALLRVALEWSGDGEHELNEREAVGHATEQVINMLAYLTTNFGDQAIFALVAEVTERREDWQREG